MRVLITNDDGIDSPGIKELVKEISKIAEVYVVAPDQERSTVAHALTLHKPLRMTKVKFSKAKRAWKSSGTPSDCVKLGLQTIIKKKIDIVISGINRGANLGTDVLYSGTVAAAIEGAMMGTFALAISIPSFADNLDFSIAAKFAAKLIKVIPKNKIPKGTLLNVNVPVKRIRGVAITKLGVRRYEDLIEKRVDPVGRTYYWLAAEPVKQNGALDTDTEAIRKNKISITPLHFNLTDFRVFKSLKESDLCQKLN